MKNSIQTPHFSEHLFRDGFLLSLGMRVGGENGLPALPSWEGKALAYLLRVGDNLRLMGVFLFSLH